MSAEAKSAPATEQKVKPTKPNEEAFKADLAQAEKEHAAVQEKLVCDGLLCHFEFSGRFNVCCIQRTNYIWPFCYSAPTNLYGPPYVFSLFFFMLFPQSIDVTRH